MSGVVHRSDRHIDEQRIGRLLRTNAVTALALSGRSTSTAALDAMARGEAQAAGDESLRAHAREMRALHAEIRSAREAR